MSLKTPHSVCAFALSLVAGGACAQMLPDHEFVPADALGGDGFGISVATNGSVGAVGALFHDEDRGAVYVYDLDTRAQLQKLMPNSIVPGDNFGRAVVLNDEYVITSSIWHGGNGTVFVFDIDTGSLVREIVAPDGNVDDRFGASLALEGNNLVVGAPYDDWAGDWSGSVYVFDLETGDMRVKFEWDETQPYDTYGIDIDIQDDLLVIGASGESSIQDIGGKVYLMNWVTGEYIYGITSENTEFAGKFGQAVAFSDDHILVGAPSHDTSWGVNAGAVYIYDIASGTEQFKLEGSDGVLLGFFGEFLNADGDRAVIGQWYGATPGSSQGRAYVYEVSTGTELGVLSAGNGIDYDLFGYAVDIKDNSVLVGAYATDRELPDVGSVYAYTLASECAADLDGNGVLDFFDVSSFLSAFNAQDSIADLNGDGLFDFFDVSDFLNAYNAGCP